MKHCHIEGCKYSQKKIIQGVCHAHYRQVAKYGDIIENIPNYKPRTRGKGIKKISVRQNTYRYFTDYVEIELTDRDGNVKAIALADLKEIERIKQYRWCHLSNGYAFTRSNGEVHYLHTFLMGKRKGHYIDHINRNRLDNRKANLRFVTPSQSGMNKSLRSDSTSGITGVTWNKEVNKWEVRIYLSGIKHHLGKFINKGEAIKARKDAEGKFYKQFKPN